MGGQRLGPIETRTQRLLLRPPRLGDAGAYFALVNDPAYAIFGARQGADRESTERGLARIIATLWEAARASIIPTNAEGA